MSASTIITALRREQAPIQGPSWLHWSTTAVVLLVAIMLPLNSAPYVNFDLTMVMVYAIGGLGLNLLTGYNGQVSLGHSAFVALGAYTAAVLIHGGWGYLAVLPISIVVCFAFGYLVGRPALRLQGLQLALVTLGLAIITPAAIKRLGSVTDGQEGINVFTATAPDWSGLADDQWIFYVTLGGLAIAWVVAKRLTAGRIGRSLVAVRDNEIVARTLGIQAAHTKTTAFAISGAFAGAAGVFYVYAVQFVGPDSFGLTMTIAFLSLIVIGGIGTVPGAIFGAFFIQYIPTVTEQVNQSASGFTYGVALVVVMFVMPRGIVGLIRAALRPLVARIPGRHPGGPGRSLGGSEPAMTAVLATSTVN
ncbi:branched-chain amino acid ABC transporter permease [Aeromicrobium sp.]|uniref:branched-chain amino acid ABC transporter permease n=1 Tax=Aeromicrobium sp. TaxID=1871063 RepID=UPI0019B9A223|nr:branched-chain amino acid ABC transporter permease [Aeromicrobium sp.]MBC7630713.1 branched-chain amino acid ABC transporter permease [Aeromicrobium sp.]